MVILSSHSDMWSYGQHGQQGYMVNMVIWENNQKDFDWQNLDGRAKRAGLGRFIPLGTVCDVQMLAEIGTNKVLFRPTAPFGLAKPWGDWYIILAAWHLYLIRSTYASDLQLCSLVASTVSWRVKVGQEVKVFGIHAASVEKRPGVLQDFFPPSIQVYVKIVKNFVWHPKPLGAWCSHGELSQNQHVFVMQDIDSLQGYES